MGAIDRIRYPRRRWLRTVLQGRSHPVFGAVMDLEIIGKESIPAEGPLLPVANHFRFLDAAALVCTMPCPLEFVSGFRMPNAPLVATLIPQMWGHLPIYGGPHRGRDC